MLRLHDGVRRCRVICGYSFFSGAWFVLFSLPFFFVTSFTFSLSEKKPKTKKQLSLFDIFQTFYVSCLLNLSVCGQTAPIATQQHQLCPCAS